MLYTTYYNYNHNYNIITSYYYIKLQLYYNYITYYYKQITNLLLLNHLCPAIS